MIVAHEFGHFLAAISLGVKVEVFSIGMGWKIIKKKIGETEYALSVLPIGGYVKMAGENPEQVSGDPREFLSQPSWKKSLIVLAGPFMNFILAFILYGLIFAGWGRELLEYQIGGFMEDSPARMAGLMPGDIIVGVNGEKTEDISEISSIIASSNPDSSVRLTVMRGDSVFTVVSKTLELEPGRRMIGIRFVPRNQNVVGAVKWRGAAWRAGLKRGDVIVSVDGRPVHPGDQLIRLFAGKEGKQVPIQWKRNGKLMEGTIIPEVQPFYPELEEGVPYPDIGIVGYIPREKLSPGRVIPAAFQRTVDSCLMLVDFLGALIKGSPGSREAVGGPVAIFVIIWESARYGLYQFLVLIALISVNLGVFNLLPIPVLDGGHLVIFTIEGLLRRQLSMKFKMVVQQAGLFLLLALILAITWKDILKFR
jgi:regulator of sigma E protease